jgi:hypothetical protein
MRRSLWKLALTFSALPWFAAAQSEAARIEESEQQNVAASFAQLVFDFCAPAVSQISGPISSLDAASPGLSIKGPFPLSEVGTWSEPLQSRLKAQPDSMIYSAITRAAAVGRFHIAYAMADGSGCVVVAQGIPDVVTEVLTRIRSNPEYTLELDGERQLYTRATTGSERSIMVVVPREARKTGTEEVLIALSQGARPRVADADREAWSKAVFRTCLQGARERLLVTASSFGEFMMERLAKNGGTSIVAPERYPPSMLFPEEKPFGCRIILSAGAEEGAKVVASWQTELTNLSAKPARGKRGEQSYLVAPASDGESGVRVTIAEMLSGFHSLAILAEGK